MLHRMNSTEKCGKVLADTNRGSIAQFVHDRRSQSQTSMNLLLGHQSEVNDYDSQPLNLNFYESHIGTAQNSHHKMHPYLPPYKQERKRSEQRDNKNSDKCKTERFKPKTQSTINLKPVDPAESTDM